MSKQALVAVSFGTSHEKTRNQTIGAIETALEKAFPERVKKRAFTSGMIMKILKNRDNLHINNVTEAMEELIKEGFTDVLVQPTHIINGDEYEKMMHQIAPFREKFEKLIVGAPLLTSSADYQGVCKSLVKQIPQVESGKNDTALVLMGHGTGHFADAAYGALDYRFKALGYCGIFVGTVEGYPDLDTVISMVKKYSPKKVILLPFMIVAGDHAINDMAGDDEDSWNRKFQEAGFETECILRGIGEFQEIQQMFIEHAREAK